MKYNKKELKQVIENSKEWKDILIHYNLLDRGSNRRTIKKYADKYNISIKHLYYNTKLGIRSEIPLSEILIEHSTYTNTGHLKKRLYKAELKKEVCELCGQGPLWYNKKIALILDHINGTHTDNRLPNLRIVCPNCNATLDTHCGKKLKYNKRQKNKKQYELKQKDLIIKVINSDIDFSKMGWVNKLAPIINQPYQKVNKWMKQFMPDFYNEKCFKRKLPISVIGNT